ncbi:MAG: hypothetical protein HYV95_10155 [Opitutae bacterium]|nr:hypothetical protein [Opitutae bacterium]
MKLPPHLSRNPRRGSIIAYIVIAMALIAVIGSVALYLTQQVGVAGGRKRLTTAYQFADGGGSIAASDLDRAYTNSPSNVPLGLTTDASFPYTLDSTLSTADENCYTRTITTPFINQSVQTQVWLPVGATSPSTARIVSTATVGSVTKTVNLRLTMIYGWGAAIISTAQGSTSTAVAKSNAQAGNVVVNASTVNRTFIDGGVIANGTVNQSANAHIPTADISQGNFGTPNQIPDYTNPGSTDQLFNFDRFMAVSDVMGTHYANTAAFKAALAAAPGGVLEGVITVDVEHSGTLPKFDTAGYPSGINIRGTLVLNFATGWTGTEKLVITTPLSINPADLSGLVIGDPTTYTTGYPATFTNSARQAKNANISAAGFVNFTAQDDLPAIMYKTAICDFHGPVNISGVVYSPIYAEIEQKSANQTQYIKGSVILGHGLLYENNQSTSKSIISFDSASVDNLATAGIKGKVIRVVDRR